MSLNMYSNQCIEASAELLMILYYSIELRYKFCSLFMLILYCVTQASRQREKADKFRDQNRISQDVKIYEGYDALLDDPEIDAVYIPLPTSMHLEWVVKAANAHKHILIEKPVAIDAEQFYIMAMTCKNNNVLLMDGVMFMHHDRLRTLNALLKDPRCGQVIRFNTLEPGAFSLISGHV